MGCCITEEVIGDNHNNSKEDMNKKNNEVKKLDFENLDSKGIDKILKASINSNENNDNFREEAKNDDNNINNSKGNKRLHYKESLIILDK